MFLFWVVPKKTLNLIREKTKAGVSRCGGSQLFTPYKPEFSEEESQQMIDAVNRVDPMFSLSE